MTSRTSSCCWRWEVVCKQPSKARSFRQSPQVSRKHSMPCIGHCPVTSPPTLSPPHFHPFLKPCARPKFTWIATLCSGPRNAFSNFASASLAFPSQISRLSLLILTTTGAGGCRPKWDRPFAMGSGEGAHRALEVPMREKNLGVSPIDVIRSLPAVSGFHYFRSPLSATGPVER